MRPEQGIIAGAVAGLIGGFCGGSKYQVYGPTAAFIPIIAAIVHKFDVPFLILSTLIAGVLIVFMGVFRLGRYFAFVPHSIIVGFTIGIAMTIMISQIPNILGETNAIGRHVIDKIAHIPEMFVNAHAHALVLALFTFFFVRKLNKISVYIPAALISMLVCTFVANQIWHDHLIPLVSTQYGDIAKNLFAFTPPSLGRFTVADLIVPVLSIAFIAPLESLLSARMADRLADNKTHFNANKELFGQGLVNVIVPLLNGFPCTGALARTATSIKVGAISPMASIFKGISVILLMLFCAAYLSSVPMAFVGGLLVYVASNMVKAHEVRLVVKGGNLHLFLMVYTAFMTIATDLSVAVVSATVLYYTCKVILEKRLSIGIEAYEHALGVVPITEHSLEPLACPQCGFQIRGNGSSGDTTRSAEAKDGPLPPPTSLTSPSSSSD
jgi:sulfate permease, SulP family